MNLLPNIPPGRTHAPRPTALLCLLAAAVALPVEARSPDDRSWAEQKCALYRRAVDDALASRGEDGLRASFLRENEAFLASGCSTGTAICPRTPEETELANMLTVMTMNEGMASTFVPFRCTPD